MAPDQALPARSLFTLPSLRRPALIPATPGPPEPEDPSTLDSPPNTPSPPLEPFDDELDSQERPQIIGGPVIPYQEGLGWYKRKHGSDLNADHSEDLTIVVALEDAIQDRGRDWHVEFAPSRGGQDHDFLLVTQRIRGGFINLGPVGEEEVVQDDLKDLLKPGPQEDAAREMLSKHLSR